MPTGGKAHVHAAARSHPSMSEHRYVHAEPLSFLARLLPWLMLLVRWNRRVLRRMRRVHVPSRPALPWWNIRNRHAVKVERVQGRRVWTVAPRKVQPSGTVLLFLHGGGFVNNILIFHWLLLDALLKRSPDTYVLPDYPLAPEATSPEIYAYVHGLYQRVRQRYPEHRIVLMGDSAGGGLALGLCQQLRAAGEEMPSAAVLLCPWLDATFAHSEVAEASPNDPMLELKGLHLAAAAYAGDLPLTDPRVSPLFGSMEGLPPIHIFSGGKDLLLSDARRLDAAIADYGRGQSYAEYPGLFHVWMALPILAEAKHALDRVAALLKEG